MKKTLFVLSLILVFILFSTVAWSDFYVIAAGKNAKRTVLVSPKSTETASGTALLNALSKISDASATNPYLIIIEPGIYDIGANSLQMKSYVDVQGSGENVTKITGNIDNFDSGVLMGANNMEIRFLTVENTGDESSSIAVSNSSSSPLITNVTAIASGGMTNIGIINNNATPTMTNVTAIATGGTGYNNGVKNIYSSPIMTNVRATSTGGTHSTGVDNVFSSSPVMNGVIATASEGTDRNKGVNNWNSSSPIMNDVEASGSGGSFNYGVYISSQSYPKITDVTAMATGGGSLNAGIANSGSEEGLYTTITNVIVTASGGMQNYGVYSGQSSAIKINNSVITGTQNSIGVAPDGIAYIGNTRLEGDVSATGPCTCAGVYDENYVFYPDTCP